MRKHFITLSILFTSLLILQACSPSSNVEDTFADVEKVTVEKINIDEIKNKDFKDFVKETLSMAQTLDQKILDSVDIDPTLFEMISTL